MGRLQVRTAAARALAAAAATTLVAGCGLAPAGHHTGASLEVTQDFGSRFIASGSARPVTGGAVTDLSFARRYVSVQTDRRGRITAIAGRRAQAGEAWSLYVNGIAATTRPARTTLNPGDELWADLHPTVGVGTVPTVVGSYPEPFTTGTGGRAYPTVEDCAPGNPESCDAVRNALNRAGVKVGTQALGGGSGQDSLAVVVGTFAQLRGIIAAELLSAGPAKSGVYAQFVGAAGQVLEADDPFGNVAETLRGSYGLIAASEQQTLNAPTWLVTGTDRAGVDAAARALAAHDLHDHYAVAVHGAAIIPLPVTTKP